jgi:hypothetical protein
MSKLIADGDYPQTALAVKPICDFCNLSVADAYKEVTREGGKKYKVHICSPCHDEQGGTYIKLPICHVCHTNLADYRKKTSIGSQVFTNYVCAPCLCGDVVELTRLYK